MRIIHSRRCVNAGRFTQPSQATPRDDEIVSWRAFQLNQVEKMIFEK